MNHRTFDQLIEAWMDLGPTSAPERVADAARLEARTTRQTATQAWPPRRFPFMNTYAKVALATAAVVVAALLGYTYVVAPNVGGPSLLPSEPTTSPTPAPTLEVGAGALAPGSYRIMDFDPISITITVPGGWESNAIPAMVWSVEETKATVAYFTVDDLFIDPCDPAQGHMGVGPTVEDLTDALSTYPGFTVSSATAATMSGFSGTLLDVTTLELDCGGEDAVMWTTQPGNIDRPYPGAGSALHQYLILDVEGERLVIASSAPSGAPAFRADQAQSIADSTAIEAP